MSYFRTAILLAGSTALFMGVGYLLGGASGAMIALRVAAATDIFAYWNSDRMVLSMYGAHEVDARTAPDLYRRVAGASGSFAPMPAPSGSSGPAPHGPWNRQQETRRGPWGWSSVSNVSIHLMDEACQTTRSVPSPMGRGLGWGYGLSFG